MSLLNRCLPAGILMPLALALLGCQGRAPGEAATSADSGAKAPEAATKPAPSESVEIDEAMIPNVKVEEVRKQASVRTLAATGKVQLNDDRTARVLAPLAGQVMDLRLRIGDPVQKDQVLFTIKSREVASLVTDYVESLRDRDLAEKTYNMTKDLFDHQAASRIALQQAEGDLAKTRARVARTEESIRILGIDPANALKDGGLRSLVPVYSPASGIVMERPVTPGQFVQPDSNPLLTIADLSTVWVLVDVFERDIHAVHVGQRVQVTAAAWPDKRFTANVERLGDKVDTETRALKVRLAIENPNQLLKPEMFVTASLVLNESGAEITAPSTAVFTEDEKSYLFIATGERRFERRLVTTAPDGEGRLRVTSGLRAGDRIVTDGAILLNYRRKQKQS